ncbi:MAG: 3-oxoacyl-[acyl-carrier-protein] reductase [Deltaproteobacteria bacterium]|nr:3-oxoacyl-[acyl-carrier-protein] reductase [Deltaproteobacteria bacterium]
MQQEKRTAFVTGGTRGIGKAICLGLAESGYNVAVGYNNDDEKARDVVGQIQQMGAGAESFQGSVENIYDTKKVIEQAIEHFGTLDVLVNNAGITADKTLRKMSTDLWLRVIQVNLFGTFHCCREALGHMLERGYGRIINISSIIALTGNVGQANYAASKAGIIGFTKSMALEMATKNITVNAVAPGFIATEMTKKIPQEVYKKIESGIPMKRFGLPEEVARLVSFLADEKSSYITGQVYGINGGLYM